MHNHFDVGIYNGDKWIGFLNDSVDNEIHTGDELRVTVSEKNIKIKKKLSNKMFSMKKDISEINFENYSPAIQFRGNHKV